MARRNSLAAALLAVGGAGLVQSGALDGVLRVGTAEEGHMSSDNPWAKDYDPSATRAVARQVYYRNCDAARAAHAAPVRIGDPGYAAHLDRDGDGVGCEPYYGG